MNLSNHQTEQEEPHLTQAGVEAVPAVSNPVLPASSSEAVVSPGQELLGEIRRLQHKMYVSLVSVVGAAPVAAGSISVLFPAWAADPHHLGIMTGGVVLFEAGLCAAVGLASRRARERLRPLIQRAADSGDIASVGALIDALEFENPTVRAAAVEALGRLLQRFTANEARQLSDAQCTCLRLTLQYRVQPIINTDPTLRPIPVTPGSVDFRIGVLHTLAAAADVRSLPVIEGLAAMFPHSVEEERAAEAARNAVRILREHVRLAQDGRVLLRPSELAAPDTLMRAAEHGTETPADLLVRAGSNGAP